MSPQIELDMWSKEALKEAENLEDFVFHWFNGQWPDLMGECIAAYNTMNYDRLEGHKYCDADRLVDSKVTTRKLRTAISLIQEAKGFEGVNGGPITDHLDAAENWINHVMLALESKT